MDNEKIMSNLFDNIFEYANLAHNKKIDRGDLGDLLHVEKLLKAARIPKPFGLIGATARFSIADEDPRIATQKGNCDGD